MKPYRPMVRGKHASSLKYDVHVILTGISVYKIRRNSHTDRGTEQESEDEDEEDEDTYQILLHMTNTPQCEYDIPQLL